MASTVAGARIFKTTFIRHCRMPSCIPYLIPIIFIVVIENDSVYGHISQQSLSLSSVAIAALCRRVGRLPRVPQLASPGLSWDRRERHGWMLGSALKDSSTAAPLHCRPPSPAPAALVRPLPLQKSGWPLDHWQPPGQSQAGPASRSGASPPPRRRPSA